MYNKAIKKKLFAFILISSFVRIPAFAGTVDCLKEALSDDIQLARSAFSEIAPGASAELSRIYSHLREVIDNKLIKDLEAKRLVNPEDWKASSKQLKENAWQAYGDKTIEDWFAGREYVLSLPKNRSITSDLLKEIHKIVTKNHKFHGFEGRRILQKLRKGKISPEEFQALKKRAFKDDEEVSGIPHSSLRGVFRYDSIDQIIHRGSRFKEDRSRYFTKKELEALRENKYVTVDEDSIKQIGENAYTGLARYEDVRKVEGAVNRILKASEEKLKTAETPEKIIEIVVLMEKDLISVHPFLDGNGRTIRLLGDYVLNRYNLPPSLYPNESDLTMPLNEAIEFRLKGMADYLREHQKELIKIQKKSIEEKALPIDQ